MSRMLRASSSSLWLLCVVIFHHKLFIDLLLVLSLGERADFQGLQWYLSNCKEALEGIWNVKIE